jgi:hypothetical protein
MIVSVMLVASPKLITRPNMVVSDQFLHQSATWTIVPVMLVVPPK